MNHFKSSVSLALCESATRPRRPTWPIHLCVIACVVAAMITLNPEAGQLWSQSASPVLASVDRVLAPWGASINQHTAPNAPTLPPMIAVVFGCVQPDEAVDEQTRAERLVEFGDSPAVGDLKSVTQPTHWRRREGQTSYRHDLEKSAD